MLLVKIFSVLFSVVPDTVVMFLAYLAHPFIYRKMKKGKWGLKTGKIIPKVFKDKDKSWHDMVVKKNALHLLKFAGEMFQARYKKERAGLKKVFIGQGKQYLDELMQSGGGFIIITGHLGNWEYAAGYISTMYRKIYAPVFVVNSKLNDALNWMRGTREVVLLETKYSAKASARAFFRMRDLLNKDEVLFIVADQEALGGEVKGKMFGKEIRIFGGPFILGQKTGKPFLPLYTFRDGKNRIVLNFEEPFYIDKEKLDSSVDRVMNFFERHIREHPDQYIWSQERW